jgi:hypothetical protein
MRIRSILSHCLVIAACIGLLFPPLARGSMVGMQADATTTETASMAGMPCCPEEPVKKDCAKSCPLMAFCATQLLAGPGSWVMALPASRVDVSMADELPLAGLDALPGRKPPRLHG